MTDPWPLDNPGPEPEPVLIWLVVAVMLVLVAGLVSYRVWRI
jgi:hypothetical protein